MKLNKEVYPIAYINDAEKGVRGSCATYFQRTDVTEEVRTTDGDVKMTWKEVDER